MSVNYLEVRPEASTEAVEDFVTLTMRGMVRIPPFQRGLKWEAKQVLELFDSIYKGYPIGSFLLRKGKAEAKRISIGPLKIDAPETHEAFWVIDGQQRLTALTVALARPLPIPKTPEDPFVVYFDAETKEFTAPSKNAPIPDTWVPVANLLDASSLTEWAYNWVNGKNPSLRSNVFDAGRRLREYRIPLYIVKTDEDATLREIFYRINNTGKSLDWSEVHDALYGNEGQPPSTIGDLSNELKQIGMGVPEDSLILACLASYRGLDVTQNLSEHYRRNPEVLRNTVQEALPTLRTVLTFLRHHAEIPHLRFLPRALPVIVLTRFYRLFPEPNARTLALLTRWTWRTFLGNAFFNERTLLRRGVAIIKNGEAEESIQNLLELVPRSLPTELEFTLPTRFDARAAESRLALLGMASLRPLDLTCQPVDIPSLIEARDATAFRSIINNVSLSQSPANRILLPGLGLARKDLEKSALFLEEAFFASHGISQKAKEALEQDNYDIFLQERRKTLQEITRELGNRLAAWSQNDRPSLEYLLQKEFDE